ncbi:MAG: DMT family transporter [Alphaproteobacteria bacterium]|nr:DMT family transporter [Alphaproteobacteria bacterium]
MTKALAADKRARLALVLLCVAGVTIGFSGILVRLSEVGPIASAFWRMAFALPVMALWHLGERRAQPAATRPPAWSSGLVAAGLLYAVELAIWHWSLKLTSVANATVIANIYPVVVTAAAWLLFRQRANRLFLIGLATAIAGMIVLVGDKFTLGIASLHGDILAATTAIFYGGYFLVVARMRTQRTTAEIMTWTAAVASAVLLPAAWLMEGSLFPPSLGGWAALIALAVLCQAGAHGAITFALAHLPASLSAVTLLIQPLTAAIMAWLILGEPIGPFQVVGGTILLGGIFIARRGSMRR